MMCIVLCSFAAAAQESLGNYKLGEDVLLMQLCGTCTYNNITSLTHPNSSILISNVVMVKDGTQYTYLVDSANLTEKGTYSVNGFGDLDGVATSWAYNFEVTGIGREFNTQTAIYYFGISIVLIFFFLVCIFVYNILPQHKALGADGRIMSVNSLAHLKLIVAGVAWGILVMISFLLWNVSEAYLTSTLAVMIFRMIFSFLLWTAMIGFPVMGCYFLYKVIADTELKKAIERGLM